MASPEYDDTVSVISECTIVPYDSASSPIQPLRLTASDLPMLTFQYIQIGCLFSGKPPGFLVIPFLKLLLSRVLSVFPPLAGHLSTDSTTGQISILCSNAGGLFVHAKAPSLHLTDIFDPAGQSDVPEVFQRFFPLNDTLSYDGHSKPLSAAQVTELADSFFIGISVNHSVVDGTTFSNIVDAFNEIVRGWGATKNVSKSPHFSRENNAFFTDAVLPAARPEATFSSDEPTRERIFHFGSQALSVLKNKANESRSDETGSENEISSFQALCALVWRCVTRVRNLAPNKMTSFVIPVNCRDRVTPKMDSSYFGNAIQIIKTHALASEVASRELGWSADLLHRTVRAHDDRTVRKAVEAWERDPHCFPLGNPDGATIIVGSSPRFSMYNINFGLGRPVAVRTGKANKFDGKFAVFPGREGGGSVDLEVVLKPETMAALVNDPDFMKYVCSGTSVATAI